jgi:hypothetical protein
MELDVKERAAELREEFRLQISAIPKSVIYRATRLRSDKGLDEADEEEVVEIVEANRPRATMPRPARKRRPIKKRSGQW